MSHEDETIAYAVDKFHGLGVAVSHEGIETVLDYIDEYYEKVYVPDDEMEVVFFTPEDVVSYINDTRPDVPNTVIHTVLDARQEFIDSLAVTEHEE